MSKLLTGLLIAGAAVAVGVVASKVLKGKESNDDFDDDIYDYPDPFDEDDDLSFDIADDNTSEEAAEAPAADEAAEEEAPAEEEPKDDEE